MGILEFAEDGESICEDDHIGLGSRQIVCDLNCSFFESFGFCLKVGGIFSCGYGDLFNPIIVPDVDTTSPISGGFCCRSICVGVGFVHLTMF